MRKIYRFPGKTSIFNAFLCLLFFTFQFAKAQTTVDLSGPTSLVVPCTDIVYTITGIPTNATDIVYDWEPLSPSDGRISAGGGASSKTITIFWSNTNVSVRYTPRVIKVTYILNRVVMH